MNVIEEMKEASLRDAEKALEALRKEAKIVEPPLVDERGLRVERLGRLKKVNRGRFRP